MPLQRLWTSSSKLIDVGLTLDTQAFTEQYFALTTMKQQNLFLFATLLLSISLPVAAADFAVSGFGTVGYARSDQPYKYQRYIDNNGTFDRDSVFGVQVDADIAPQWSATVQAKAAPALKIDGQWETSLSWAFLSWRPSNDLLLRLGKLRLPGFMNSENMDVGVTFDYARLPVELYSAAPTQDFTGASFNKTWGLENGELGLDGLWGQANSSWRRYLRDGIPGKLPAGAIYDQIRVTSRGLTLTYRANENTYRLGINNATAKRTDGQLWTDYPVLVDLGRGISYYNMDPSTGIPARDSIDISLITFGADIDLGNNFRTVGEYIHRRLKGVEGELNSGGGYLSLLKRTENWTPYVSYSWLQSDKKSVDLYRALNGTTVPAWVPGSATINASQRAAADFYNVFDQHSWALGTSYLLSPTSKLKAEWSRTHIGIGSGLIDAPSGSNVSNVSNVSNQNINVFSLSYNFVF